MNAVIKQMKERKSCRHFEPNKKIPKEILQDILLATQNAPTSVYGQQYSAIIIQDKDKLKHIQDMIASKKHFKPQKHIGECSAFVLFVSDFNKMKEVVEYEGKQMRINENIEALLTGAVDVGIALGAMSVAAESAGLGSVCIGALRGAMQECIDYFKLPKYVLPICGMCLGYPTAKGASVPKKLRLPLKSFAFEDEYKLDNFKQTIKEYNELTAKEVYANRFRWSENITAYYANEKYPENEAVIKQQGY